MQCKAPKRQEGTEPRSAPSHPHWKVGSGGWGISPQIPALLKTSSFFPVSASTAAALEPILTAAAWDSAAPLPRLLHTPKAKDHPQHPAMSKPPWNPSAQ